jgi:hypothetical protein
VNHVRAQVPGCTVDYVKSFTILSNLNENLAVFEDFADFAPDRSGSDPSGPAEADRHLAVVDDDRDGAAAFAELEHARELRGVLLDVDVLELDMPPCIVVTGGLRVGSRVLAENLDHHPIVEAFGPEVLAQAL